MEGILIFGCSVYCLLILSVNLGGVFPGHVVLFGILNKRFKNTKNINGEQNSNKIGYKQRNKYVLIKDIIEEQ